ncbi:mannose-1-phosphate guanylyltransferase/mannose-6-phosphate isomerase [Chthonobacter albigriseus]|uniref:mannose-1-phosphate guanylyltransferase/mannose-6-phosphate isomerase n=1 Tax=Chthonobacter albigriseus TaxID=1683161 RepID=UPI0015EEF689|nr:mannose-1-phosphate guanylyltransferase/mannose-6-phosphate isomerase [Chthonobacter albigriseus]
MTLVTPAIMIGGTGTRLWPLSRTDKPKQFHKLGGDFSLLQQTLQRFTGPTYGRPWLLTGERGAGIGEAHAAEIGVELGGVVIEPTVRSTAPALAAAALAIGDGDPDRLILAAPADHLMAAPADFHRAVAAAIPVARAGHIVTFGIRPTHAETGFGYIAVERGMEGVDGVFRVESFVEKPRREVAEAYLGGGRHVWNAGIFLFTAATLLDEINRHAPEVAGAVMRAFLHARTVDGRLMLDLEAFASAPEISIDHAVMEKSDVVAVAPCDPAWNDVGSWAAVLDVSARDDKGNAVVGDAIVDRTENCLVQSVGGRLIAITGVSNLAVIDTEDVTMITSIEGSQNVKDLVKQLNRADRPEATTTRTLEHAWGTTRQVTANDTFQVKHLVLNPGHELKARYHHHRSLHWTVVAGTVEVVIDGVARFLRQNQSVHVPDCAVHSLRNPGRLPAHVVVVEHGAYLGEDDLVEVSDPPRGFDAAIAAE